MSRISFVFLYIINLWGYPGHPRVEELIPMATDAKCELPHKSTVISKPDESHQFY
jgi:hypothetical protein